MGECLPLTQQTSAVTSPETGMLTHDLTEVRIPWSRVAGLSDQGAPSPFLDLPLFCCMAFSQWPHLSVPQYLTYNTSSSSQGS